MPLRALRGERDDGRHRSAEWLLRVYDEAPRLEGNDHARSVTRGRYSRSETCCGLPFRFAEANSSNCFSLMDSYIDFDAPFRRVAFCSPLFAASAAPAAFCWACDLAGIIRLPFAALFGHELHARADRRSPQARTSIARSLDRSSRPPPLAPGALSLSFAPGRSR